MNTIETHIEPYIDQMNKFIMWMKTVDEDPYYLALGAIIGIAFAIGIALCCCCGICMFMRR